jgi:hypothetical protein
MKKFKEYLQEKIDWKIPEKPGTVPIPQDHVRLYHQTHEKNLPSIKHNGIQFKHARGIEGPRAIYADEKGFYGKPGETPTVEFHVHKDRWHPPFVTGDDVKPQEIIGVHKKWHKKVRYIEDNKDVLHNVLSGEHDDLLKDEEHKKAIRYIKKKHKTKDTNDDI